MSYFCRLITTRESEKEEEWEECFSLKIYLCCFFLWLINKCLISSLSPSKCFEINLCNGTIARHLPSPAHTNLTQCIPTDNTNPPKVKQARKPRSYGSPATDLVTGVMCRATSVAKNYEKLSHIDWHYSSQGLMEDSICFGMWKASPC